MQLCAEQAENMRKALFQLDVVSGPDGKGGGGVDVGSFFALMINLEEPFPPCMYGMV